VFFRPVARRTEADTEADVHLLSRKWRKIAERRCSDGVYSRAIVALKYRRAVSLTESEREIEGAVLCRTRRESASPLSAAAEPEAPAGSRGRPREENRASSGKSAPPPTQPPIVPLKKFSGRSRRWDRRANSPRRLPPPRRALAPLSSRDSSRELVIRSATVTRRPISAFGLGDRQPTNLSISPIPPADRPRAAEQRKQGGREERHSR